MQGIRSRIAPFDASTKRNWMIGQNAPDRKSRGRPEMNSPLIVELPGFTDERKMLSRVDVCGRELVISR